MKSDVAKSITALLLNSSPMLASEIAWRLNIPRKRINQVLHHELHGSVEKDADFRWRVPVQKTFNPAVKVAMPPTQISLLSMNPITTQNEAVGVAAISAQRSHEGPAAPPSDQEVREKDAVIRLFEFIRALEASKHSVCRDVLKQPVPQAYLPLSSFPQQSEWVQWWSGNEQEREWLLRLALLPANQCPTPPQNIALWLLPGWQTPQETLARFAPDKPLRRAESGLTEIEPFEADVTRVTAAHTWQQQRGLWRAEHLRHQPVRDLYARLQAVRAELGRQSEQCELVLGCAHFMFEHGAQRFSHPLIYKAVQLDFDSRTNALVISETNQDAELYAELLTEIAATTGADLSLASDWREQVKELHPLDTAAQTLTRTMAHWLENQPALSSARIEHAPALFVRDKGGWVARAASEVLTKLLGTALADIPSYLRQLAGVLPPEQLDGEGDEPLPADTLANESEDILLALPANLEQLQLARQVSTKDVVLVQGPPGTGKTHTIANLIGHLLAQGQRVLVTSHTSKALRVLREKVPENVRSLCVSVLNDTAQSKRELEAAVGSIAERMQSGQQHLDQQARQGEDERARVLHSLKVARQQQRLCLKREYDPLVIGGESFMPSLAARLVRDGAERHTWIPGPLLAAERGAVCPLSATEVQWLYQSQTRISEAAQAELEQALPDVHRLPSPVEWQNLLAQRREHQQQAWLDQPIWPGTKAEMAILTRLIEAGEVALRQLDHFQSVGPWLLTLVEQGWALGAQGAEWQELDQLAKAVQLQAEQARPCLLEHDPQLPDALCTDENIVRLQGIVAHLQRGKSLSFLQVPLGAGWQPVLKAARCNDRPAAKLAEFEALLQSVQLLLARARLQRRWSRQIAVLSGPDLPQAAPETAAVEWAGWILRALNWATAHWHPLTVDAARLGIAWSVIDALFPPVAGERPRLSRARALLEQRLLPEWRAHRACRASEQLETDVAQWRHLLRPVVDALPTSVCASVDRALRDWNGAEYEAAHHALLQRVALKADHHRRLDFMQRMQVSASAWAAAVGQRRAGHDAPLAADTDIAAAWQWRQLSDELDHRNQLDPQHIARQIAQLTRSLEQVTSQLIADRAWARQLRHAQQYRQHLTGWLVTQARIGKGSGKNADANRLAAREQLRCGQNAVPVWIMPLAQVFQSLSVADSQFDVVIIDEASQAGVTGLLAAYLGKKVIVVGDHEQVSPDAVGSDNTVSLGLQQQYLQGIPSRHLYDSKLSLYDLTRGVAAGMLSLTEHFRCVPSIIGFSNQLSYNGRIKPLRPPAQSRLLPHVVAHRVRGQRQGKVNQEEAVEIVSLVAAMCQHAAYAGKSIGVISLLGDEQVHRIETLLQKHIPMVEYEARRMLCGNAAQFQGDERQVMLLSMVDSNEGDGPMRLTSDGANDMTKKRYNVACSRAQDQLWIVHSMDHQTDLKPGDLRRQLLDYATVSQRDESSNQSLPDRTDSEFERLVLKQLRDRGYTVKTQFSVGYYRLDLVVEGSDGQRLAIECDGDRYHSGAEKLAEDSARQAVLERLGWQFERIRGSQYFRSADQALLPVWARLAELGIAPQTLASPSLPTSMLHEEILRTAQTLRNAWFPS